MSFGVEQNELIPLTPIEGSLTEAPFYTGNPDKQNEIRRIVGSDAFFVEGNLSIPEIQSRDPEEVAKAKAISAWKENHGSPVVVEDNSIRIPSFEHLFPSPYVNDWAKTREAREDICQIAGGSPAVAQVIYAVYDGQKVHMRIGQTEGTIASSPRGTHGFGWDDFFIPEGDTRTFAEMTDAEKDLYSMRRKALEAIHDNPFSLGRYTFQMPPPDSNELTRIQKQEFGIQNSALQFAYLLEPLEGNSPDENLTASVYTPIQKGVFGDDGVVYYERYTQNPDSPSLGLLLSPITKSRIQLTHRDGDPVLFQIGPDQRMLALAQRVEFFSENQNPEIHRYIDALESGEEQIEPRPIRKHVAIEQGLGIVDDQPTKTIALEEIGYKKRSSEVLVSRNPQKNGYLLNRIGRYPRRIILGGSMPPATGGVDALTTEALAHMATFIPRNSIFNSDLDRQIKLAQKAHGSIDLLSMPEEWKARAKRNIGASLGIDDPSQTLRDARRLYEEGDIKLFRIYTIGSDSRVIETARYLRDDPKIGKDIEIFVGQIPDKKLASRLIDEVHVDALIYGHGGGRQCTSADNGMAVTTLEEIYDIVTDPKFQKTTVLVEGGAGRNIGSMLILGADGILYNGRLVRGTIESPAGDIYVRENVKGKFCQPYSGSASAETQLIEAQKSDQGRRMNLSGRIYTEGSPGFMTHERKAGGSMVFWINSLLRDAARMFADMGVRDISELRQLLKNSDIQPLRQVSLKAKEYATAYKGG